MFNFLQTIHTNYRYFVAYLFTVFVSLNIILFAWFGSIYFDITEEQRFSISKNTLEIIKKIPERVDLTLYISESIITQMPTMKIFVNRVQDYLSQLEKDSNGRLKIKTRIVQPYSVQEEYALAAGLQAIPLQNQSTGLLFGLVAENMVDGEGVIPFLSPQRETFMEYDIANLIQGVIDMDRKTVAIASSLPLATGTGGVQSVLNNASQPYYIYQALQKKYNLMTLSDDYHELIDTKTRPHVALILHPRPLSKKALDNLKYYALTGGRLLISVDPFSESEPLPVGDKIKNAEIYSDIPSFFKSIGLLYNHHKIILDHHHGQSILYQQNAQPILHLELLKFNFKNFNTQIPVMSNIKLLNFVTAGSLVQDFALSDNQLIYTPLVYSQKKAGSTTRRFLSSLQNRSELKKIYKAEDPYIVAMMVTGKPNNNNMSTKKPIPQELLQEIAVIVIADSDFLDDRMWLRKDKNTGELAPFADNLNIVLNYIDYLMGDDGLIKLRGKKIIERPLLYLDDIKTENQKIFLEEEKKLQEKIQQLRLKIQKINQNYSAASSQKMPIAIQEKVQEFSYALNQSHADLRRIQRKMNVDLQSTEQTIKIINMLLMPILFGIIAIFILYLRKSKNPSKRHEG